MVSPRCCYSHTEDSNTTDRDVGSDSCKSMATQRPCAVQMSADMDYATNVGSITNILKTLAVFVVIVM